MSNTFNTLKNSDEFKTLLEKLPKEERAAAEKAILELIKIFELNILIPLEKLENDS